MAKSRQSRISLRLSSRQSSENGALRVRLRLDAFALTPPTLDETAPKKIADRHPVRLLVVLVPTPACLGGAGGGGRDAPAGGDRSIGRGGVDGAVTLRESATGQRLRALETTNAALRRAALSPDGQRGVAVADRAAWVWFEYRIAPDSQAAQCFGRWHREPPYESATP